MARIFFLGIVFYLAYRLLFDLILPVYQTTRKVRRQFSGMRDRAQAQENGGQPKPGAREDSSRKSRVGEYIDFEEVKEPH